MTTRFAVLQRFNAPLDAVEAAFVDPRFFARLSALPKLGEPVVLSCDVEGDVVRLRVRYQFAGELSSAARAVLDPARLTWVESAEHNLALHRARFRLIADHYADRFACHGSYRFEQQGEQTTRHAEGEVAVHAPFIGHAVERAIVSGLEEHLHDEVPLVEDWLARRLPRGGP